MKRVPALLEKEMKELTECNSEESSRESFVFFCEVCMSPGTSEIAGSLDFGHKDRAFGVFR